MKAIRIDDRGFFLEDIPHYQGGETSEIILELPPDGLWHPRWNGLSWEEGLTPQQITERQAPTEPPAPDYKQLKEALAPLYREYLSLILSSPEASTYLSSVDTEINSSIPSELILEIKLKRLFDSISVSVEDTEAINLALKKSKFTFEL